MTGQKSTKINKLLLRWPHGTVAVHAWLEEQGIYRQLADSYRRSSWIVPIGRGAFVRADDKVEWPGAVYAVQHQLDQRVHVGAKSALELQGAAHFIPMKRRTVWLLCERGHRLPSWLLKRDWGARIQASAPELFKPDQGLGLESIKMGDFEISVASRERAILEVLHFVPQKQSFEEASLLMEGLTTLRHELLQQLLERCRSVKVKRLFLHLAEVAGHPWLKRLEISKISLGSGKREIVKGGRLDPKYQITVPHGSGEGEE